MIECCLPATAGQWEGKYQTYSQQGQQVVVPATTDEENYSVDICIQYSYTNTGSFYYRIQWLEGSTDNKKIVWTYHSDLQEVEIWTRIGGRIVKRIDTLHKLIEFINDWRSQSQSQWWVWVVTATIFTQVTYKPPNARMSAIVRVMCNAVATALHVTSIIYPTRNFPQQSEPAAVAIY
jgi:hypothetical protein